KAQIPCEIGSKVDNMLIFSIMYLQGRSIRLVEAEDKGSRLLVRSKSEIRLVFRVSGEAYLVIAATIIESHVSNAVFVIRGDGDSNNTIGLAEMEIGCTI